jgi:hypothetical protein
MFKIDGTKILLTRGDKCTITLKLKNENEEHILNPNDVISFTVYNKKAFNEKPLISKEIIINESTNNIDICLDSDDTKIGEITNKPIDYWYEIQLNHEQTIIGYDIDGPKILKLYPEGSDIE